MDRANKAAAVGKLDRARQLGLDALQHAFCDGFDKRYLTRILGCQASIEMQLDQYVDALGMLLTAELHRGEDSFIHRQDVLTIKCNTAVCMRHLGQYQKAERLYDEILAELRNEGLSDMMALQSVQLVRLLVASGKLQRADKLITALEKRTTINKAQLMTKDLNFSFY